MTTKTVKHTYGDGTIKTLTLLTAAEGKALTNDGGVTLHNCVAVEDASGWAEIAAAAVDEPITDTEALEIITGGTA